VSLPSHPKTYTITRRSRGLFFICAKCNYEVEVKNGHNSQLLAPARRTAAAAAMKIHVECEHREVHIPLY